MASEAQYLHRIPARIGAVLFGALGAGHGTFPHALESSAAWLAAVGVAAAAAVQALPTGHRRLPVTDDGGRTGIIDLADVFGTLGCWPGWLVGDLRGEPWSGAIGGRGTAG
jgi:hypothetical protein